MKTTYLLLTVCLVQAFAETSAQKLTIQREQVALRNIFSEIQRQTGYSVVYSVKHVERLPAVTVALVDASLQDAMREILADLPLDFVVTGKEIVIKERLRERSPSPVAVQTEQRQQTASGRVLDEQGVPLAGAAVKVKATALATSTDSDGRFTIGNVEANAVLVISFVGYASREISASENLSAISLKPVVSDIEEVVVVGYGTQRKSDITGAVSSIRAEDFNKGTNTTFDQLIAGKAAGVQFVQNSGEPGGGVAVRIRGASSVNAGTSPLYVIDGLPMDNSNVAGGGGANFDAPPSPRNPLAGINPQDIESIEILKDASATAIYGSRGANGVIMVTTKKGKAGRNTVSYSGSYGQQQVANTIGLLSTAQYVQVINELIDAGGGPESNRIANAGGVVGTDWQAEVFDNRAPIQNHSLAFSGGTEQTRYYFGLNAFDQGGILRNTAFSRYAARLNLSSNITDRLEVGTSINVSYSLDKQVPSGFGINAQSGAMYTALNFDPTLSIYENDGSYQLSTFLDMDNPMSLINEALATSNAYRTFGTAYAQFKITPELTAKVNAGGDITNRRRDVYVGQKTRRAMAAGGSGSVLNGMLGNYLLEGTLTYDRRWDNHYLNVMGGATTQRFVVTTSSQNADGFPSDVTGSDNLGLGNQETFRMGTSRGANRLLSYLGRVNYELKNKYLFTASIRADGSSRFGINNRFGYFPSFALGWKMMEEEFMQDVSLFSELKPRFSWGQTGNQEIGNYSALTTFGGGPSAILDDKLAVGTQPARYPNPNLKWETTQQLNAGIDFSVLNGRISASVDYFTKTTFDMLFQLPIPSSTGYPTQLTNVGRIRNRGWEFAVNSDNLTGNLKWTTQVNLATLANDVLDIGQDNPIISGGAGQTTGVFILRPGSPLFSFYGWEIDGIWQEGDDFSVTRDAVAAGDIKYRDVNGDGTVNGEDRVLLGNTFPSLTWSLGNQLSYKGFSLAIFLDGVSGVKMLNNNLVESYFPVSFRRNRYAELYLNRWTPENPSNRYPSFVNPGGQGDKRVNSYTVEDASYARIRTVSLTYQVPTGLSYLKNLGVSLAIENLATFTKYTGFDPTINPSGGAFDRIDYNAYPLARTWMVGLTADF